MIDYDTWPGSVVVTVDFRDGPHDVPDYFMSLMARTGIDFHAVTLEEARELVSKVNLRTYLNGVVGRTIADHRRQNP